MNNVISLNPEREALSLHHQECLRIWATLRIGKSEAIQYAAEIMDLIQPSDFMLVLQAIAGDNGNDAFLILDDLTIEAVENLAGRLLNESA